MKVNCLFCTGLRKDSAYPSAGSYWNRSFGYCWKKEHNIFKHIRNCKEHYQISKDAIDFHIEYFKKYAFNLIEILEIMENERSEWYDENED
jgi:hypothetical protein